LEVLGAVVGVAGLVIAFAAWYPSWADRKSSPEERAGYIATVDAMCGAATDEHNRVLGRYPDDPGEAIAYFSEEKRIYGTLFERWAAIPWPRKSDDELLRPILNSFLALIHGIDSIIKLLQRGGDTEAAINGILAKRSELTEDIQSQARAYGFRSCAVM
jgi:hypothetical protein